MVKYLLAAGWLLLALTPAFASLRLVVEPQSVALGRAVEVVVEGSRTEVDQYPLLQLEKNFIVHSRAIHETDDVTRMVLTLFPRRAGRIELPPASGSSSRPLAIEVLSAAVDEGGVRFSTHVGPRKPTVRAATIVRLDVEQDGLMGWQAMPALHMPHALVVPLSQTQLESDVDGQTVTIDRYEWRVIPLKAGELRGEYGPITATRLGRVVMFQPSAFRISVGAVPAWLPVTVPVGAVHVTASKLPAEIPLGRPYAWTWEVRGSALTEGEILSWFSALKTRPGVTFYAPSIEAQPALGRDNVFIVTTPFKLTSTGEQPVPGLRVSYYDPETGRLGEVEVARSSVTGYRPWLRHAASWSLTVVLVGAVFLLLFRYRRAWDIFVAKFRAYAAVRRADNWTALAAALRQWEAAAAMGGAEATDDDKGRFAQLKDVVRKSRYGPPSPLDEDFDQIKVRLMGHLRKGLLLPVFPMPGWLAKRYGG